MEDVSHAHIVSLMSKLISSAKEFDDLSIGFDRSSNRRQQELTNIKNVKGKNHRRIMLKDVFGFSQHQEKAIYGLDYKLTLTRNKDYAVIDKAAGFADARKEIDHIHWCLPQYKPAIQQKTLLSKQISSKTPSELRYVEPSKSMELRIG